MVAKPKKKPVHVCIEHGCATGAVFCSSVLAAMHELLVSAQTFCALSEAWVSARLQFDEQRDQVTVERILRVVFLDPESTNPALEKLKYQLAEADTALEEIKKKPSADVGPQVNGEGLVLDEWKERREKYLARQQVEAVDSV